MILEELAQKLEGDSSLESFLEPDEVLECCREASLETGWTFPVTGAFRTLWIERRAKRHCFVRLWTQSARKFKVEQLHLNQRFDHYGKVIEQMDAEFRLAMEDNPMEFMDVDPHKALGSVIGPGFIYDITGKDVTGFFSK